MFTDYLANRILNAIATRIEFVQSRLYIGLSSTTPVDVKGDNNWNFTEPNSTGNGYKRVLIGQIEQSGTWYLTAAENKASTNDRQIAFNQATGSWGTLTYAGLFDAETEGNLLWFGELTDPITPEIGHVAIISEGDLDLSLT